MTAASSPEDSGTQEFGVQRIYPPYVPDIAGEPYGDVVAFLSAKAAGRWASRLMPGTYRTVIRDVSEWREA